MVLHHAKGHRLELPSSVSAPWLAELLLWDGNGVWLCQRRLAGVKERWTGSSWSLNRGKKKPI
jgi:hypothetical protein